MRLNCLKSVFFLSKKKNFFSGVVFLAASLAGVSGHWAAALDWNGGAGNWSSWAAWANSASTDANINSGPLTVDLAVTAQNIKLNNNSTLNVSNNLTARFLNLTASATPTANIQSGTVTLQFLHLTNGTSLSACPVLNISGGATTINVPSGRSDALVVGYDKFGKIAMTGGTLNLPLTSSNLSIGLNSNAVGLVEFSGGTITANSTIFVGNAGTGTLNVSQPTATLTRLTAPYLTIGNTGSGTLTISGGTVESTNVLVGSDGTGSLNVSGGTLTTGSLIAAKTDAGSATVSVSGSGQLLVTGNCEVGSVGSTATTISGGSFIAKNGTAFQNILFGNSASSTANEFTMSGGRLEGKDLLFAAVADSSITMKVSGGTISATNVFVGQYGNATLEMTDGTITPTAEFIVSNKTGTASAVISGGTIDPCQVIIGSGGSGSLTLTGTAKMNLTGKNIFVGNWGASTLTLSGSASLTANDLVLRNHTATGSVSVIGGNSTISLANLRAGADTSVKCALNFVLTETGLSTLGVGAVSLGDGITISVDEALTTAGFTELKSSYTLIDASSMNVSGVTLTSKSDLFMAPEISGTDLIVRLNAANSSYSGQAGHFPLAAIANGENINQIFIDTNLTDETELQDFAAWLSTETGVTTQVERTGVYVYDSMSPDDFFLWDFTSYSGASLPVLMTRVGLNSSIPGVPEPAAITLLLLAIPFLPFLPRRRRSA